MKRISPSRIDGTIAAPPSKSLMIRAVAAALLAGGETRIDNPTRCEDARAALRVAEALGARIQADKEPIRIRGGLSPRESLLNCGESGLCLRLMSPIAALSGQSLTMSGGGSLRTRPMDMIASPLQALGAACTTNDGFLPIRLKGPIRGGAVEVDGSLSSQFLSGLLMALPLCAEDSEIAVKNLNSRPYVDLTLEICGRFGIKLEMSPDYDLVRIPGRQSYRSCRYKVDGDWSGAAFPLAAGAIAGRATVTGLDLESLQGDRKILDAFRLAGSKVTGAGGRVTVERDRLEAFDFDATECPDLFPPLAVLACACKGRSLIRGIERLRHKESDRALAIVEELGKLGGAVTLTTEGMKIEGGILTGGSMNSRNDHRIAMAGALAGLISRDGVSVADWRAVTKSYPKFFQDLKSLGGKVA